MQLQKVRLKIILMESFVNIEGIANGIEKLYKDRLLRNSLSKACKEMNHDNKEELKKLYKLF